MLTEKNEQIEKLIKHYSNFYSRQNTALLEAFDSLKCLQTIDKVDSVRTIEKLNSGIDDLTDGKTLESENIPPNLIIHGSIPYY